MLVRLCLLFLVFFSVQVSLGQVFPSTMVFQNFPTNATYGIVDGYYMEVGQEGAGGGTIYQRYITGTNSNPNMMAVVRFFTNTSIYTIILQNSFNAGTIASKSVTGTSTSFPSNSWTGGWIGSSGYVPGSNATAIFPTAPTDPYDDAFPDWERAMLMIPLGFSAAGLIFATCFAFVQPMRWVRDIATWSS